MGRTRGREGLQALWETRLKAGSTSQEGSPPVGAPQSQLGERRRWSARRTLGLALFGKRVCTGM